MGQDAAAAACYEAATTRAGIWAALAFLLALVAWATWQQWTRRDVR